MNVNPESTENYSLQWIFKALHIALDFEVYTCPVVLRNQFSHPCKPGIIQVFKPSHQSLLRW